jgi:FkbM family methyltransferase
LYKKYKQQIGFLLKDLGFIGSVDVNKHYASFEWLYDRLEDQQSKKLLLDLLGYWKLGYARVKLPLCNWGYIAGIEAVKKLADCSEPIKPGFLNWELCRYNLASLGYPIELHFIASAIYIDFVLQQYKYRSGEVSVGAANGDVVIDAGGCWGDTALYFAHEAGEQGKVYVCEFIPNNIKIMQRNFDLNPALKERIQLVPNPVWKTSGKKMYFVDKGPASMISDTQNPAYDQQTETISIDDLVAKENIQKLDMIKMDIEGAEISALEGAMDSIRRFRPKLAICVYHNLSDFFEVPRMIHELQLGYKFYLGHYTHMAGETVLFAIAD